MDIEKYIKSGIIEQYVLGLSSPEERKEVEFMAKKYPEVHKHILEMQNCMEQYAEMHAVPPPNRLKRKVLNRIEEEIEHLPNPQTSSDSTVFKIPAIFKWASGIAALMVVTLSVLCLILYQGQQESRMEMGLLSTQMKHLQDDYNALKGDNEKMKTSYVVLKDVGTRHVDVVGSNIAPEAHAVVYWNKDHNKAYLNAVNIPKAPHGHDYQVWANVNGKHVSMGILKAADTLELLHNLPFIENCGGIVITIEKEGGSKHPTVEKLFAKGEM